MNPIYSELMIQVIDVERRHNVSTGSLRLPSREPGLARRLANTIWQWLDPRGYALAQVPSSAVAAVIPAPEASLAPVTRLPVRQLPITEAPKAA